MSNTQGLLNCNYSRAPWQVELVPWLLQSLLSPWLPSHPFLLSSFVCPCSSDPAVSFCGGEGDQGKTDFKPNNKMNSFLLVYTLDSLHCRASSRWEHRPGKDGQTRNRQSQVGLGCPWAAVRLSLREQGKNFSQFLYHHFEIFNYSQQSGQKGSFLYIHINKGPSPAWIDRQVISSRGPLPWGISSALRCCEQSHAAAVGFQPSGTGQAGHASVAWRKDRHYG